MTREYTPAHELVARLCTSRGRREAWYAAAAAILGPKLVHNLTTTLKSSTAARAADPSVSPAADAQACTFFCP